MLRRILVPIGYLLITLVIVGGTVLLVAYGQGYEFDFSRGAIVHKGLVLIGATPSSSIVTRRGSSLHKHTTYHATYSPGSYTFTVSKDGFRSWTKTLNVGPGLVSDARYILLLPQTLVHATVAQATAFTDATPSRDHRHLAYVLPASTSEPAGVDVLDLPNGQPQRVFTVPIVTDPATAETIDRLQWSDDASHLLVFSHTASGALVREMASDGTNVVDLTTTYATDLSNLEFAPTDWHLLYGITATGELRRIDLNATSISGVLASNVSQISFANDQLLFVQTTKLGKTLSASPVHTPTSIAQLVPSLPASDSYTVSYSSFQGDDELVVIPSSTREATYYSGIFGSSPLSTVVARNVDHALFSPSGRYVALYSGSTLITYDLLLSSPKQIVTFQSPALTGPLAGLTWADNFHLLLNMNGREVISDFDGTNRQDLGATTAIDLPFTSSDQHTAYALAPVNGDKQQFIATALR